MMTVSLRVMMEVATVMVVAIAKMDAVANNTGVMITSGAMGGTIIVMRVVVLATMMTVGVTAMMIMVHPRVSWLWKNSYSLC
jgi:hypothetical protein